MLVDLKGLRPQNESYEHFIIKQIARAWFFKKGLRYIACEVLMKGADISPNGHKVIADVVGLDRKKRQQPAMTKMFNKIHAKAIEIGTPLGLTEEGWRGVRNFVSTYKLKGDEKISKEVSIESCYEQASLLLGMSKDAHIKLRNPYKKICNSYVGEVKVSKSDYMSGYNVNGDYNYLFAPKGIIPKEELPSFMGLVEVDLEKFYETKDWESCTEVVKKVKKKYDSSFFDIPLDPKSFNIYRHDEYCEELVFGICQESTEETVFWNPFLRNVPDGGSKNPNDTWRFKHSIGEVTPLGIVIDRRTGEKSKKELEAEEKERDQAMRHNVFGFYNISRFTAYYKFVVPNEGITKWISQESLQKEIEVQKNKAN